MYLNWQSCSEIYLSMSVFNIYVNYNVATANYGRPLI